MGAFWTRFRITRAMGETRLKQAGVSGLYASSAHRTQGAADGNGRRDHRYDLGVLLVAANEPKHQGAALLQFSDALYHWLERSRASVPAKDSHGAPVELRSAVLEPQGEEPARTELLLTASPAGGASITTRWLLAESWFPEPTADSDVKALTRWLLKALPWFFIEYVDAEAHRAARIPGPPVAPL